MGPRPPTYRLYNCQRCSVQTRICQRCDHGQIYCGAQCARIRRRECVRRAGARYQRTRRGASCHAARQRAWRARRQAVTHQGSPSGELCRNVSDHPISTQDITDAPRRRARCGEPFQGPGASSLRILWRAVASMDAATPVALERIGPHRAHRGYAGDLARAGGRDPAAASRGRLARRHDRPSAAGALQRRASRADSGRYRARAQRTRPSKLDAYVPFIQDTFTRYPTLRASRLYRMVRERLRQAVRITSATSWPAIGRAPPPRHICAYAHSQANRGRSTGRTLASCSSGVRAGH